MSVDYTLLMNKYNITKNDLYRLVINDLKSYQQIADKYGCSISTIQYYIDKFKIKENRMIKSNIRLTNKTLQWILRKNLKIVGEYNGSRANTTFECIKGHQWEGIPMNVRVAKNPCPICNQYYFLLNSLKNKRKLSMKLERFKHFCNKHNMEYINPYEIKAKTGIEYFKSKIEVPARLLLEQVCKTNETIRMKKMDIWNEVLKIEQMIYDRGIFRNVNNICSAASYRIFKTHEDVHSISQTELSILFNTTPTTLRSTYKLVYAK